MKKVLSIIITVLLLSYLIFSFFLTKGKKKDVACHKLIVVIKDSMERNFLSETDIISFLKKNELYPVNRLYSQINTEAIKQKLFTNELIAAANVYKTPSGSIKIEITQKMPVLRIFAGQESFYLDETGNIMPASFRYPTYLPIANGNIEKSRITTDLYEFALFLQKHKFWNNQIEQIYIHPNQEVELIPRIGEHHIILGDFEDFKEKMNKLQLFYEQAIPKLGWNRYEIINLKYKDQIVCTKK
ncbi:MAG: cell division protein FtsQ [Tannerella sp.]|jgi:cell division protein FtsQ|nr:cell division protein FtsQ [Tannerella sp.]